MRKVQKYLSEYFKISIQEARGAVLVFVLLLIVFVANRFYSSYTLAKTSEIAISSYGGVALPEQDEPNFGNYNNKYNNYKGKLSYKDKVAERFPFNPNEVSDADLKRLGFPPYLAKIIVNYRSKGGKFKYKEDLLKIYAMKPEVYQAVYPLMSLPSKTESGQQKDYQEEKIIVETGSKPIFNAGIKSAENPIANKKREVAVFDLNTADTTQLMALNGIGRGYANRIIKFRDALGGFYALDQVSETFGLPPDLMPEIKKRCILSGNHKKIYINKTDFIKHPYLKYNLAKSIINFRKQHGNFNTSDDLKSIISLDQATIDKIKPYLDFSLP